jgi:hypothetical protein
VSLGYLNASGSEQLNLTGSTYLLEKYIKHTLPPTQLDLITIFSDASYENYKSSTVNALASGSTIVNNSKIDVVWFSNQANGISFVNAVPQNNTDVVKTVLHHDAKKIHSYPVNSTDLITKTCNKCGTNILTGTTI